MLVAGAWNVKIATANVINSLVVNQEGTVRVLNGAVSRKDGIVRLDHCSGHARGGIDGKLQLGLLAIVGRETLE